MPIIDGLCGECGAAYTRAYQLGRPAPEFCSGACKLRHSRRLGLLGEKAECRLCGRTTRRAVEGPTYCSRSCAELGMVTPDTLLPERARPRRRSECGSERPCPWLGCRYHLLGPEVLRRRGDGVFAGYGLAHHYRRSWTDDDVIALLRRMAFSCALDAAADGPRTLDQIGELLGITRERVRQIEDAAKAMLARSFGPDDVFDATGLPIGMRG